MENLTKNTDETEQIDNAEDIRTPKDSTGKKNGSEIAKEMAEAEKMPIVATLLSHPRLCELIGDIAKGADEDEAIGRVFTEWTHNVPITEFPENSESSKTAEILAVINGIRSGEISDETVRIVRMGLNYDEDLATAKQQGYIDGKNAKIDIEKRAATGRAGQPQSTFPEYAKKSIWD